MQATSRTTRKKSWQRRRTNVSLLAEMALRQERVAAVLKELRENHALTQEQAAAKVDTVTYRQWQRWEAGESMPYARNLSAVADSFEFPLARFYDEDEAAYRTPQLDRIEAKLDDLIEALSSVEADPRKAFARRLGEAVQQHAQHPDSKPADVPSQPPADEAS